MEKKIEDLDLNVSEPKTIQVETGITKNQRDDIAHNLKQVLADSYCLMLMTQNYHWNVKGKSFRDIHLMTEEQYEDLFAAVDEIAERIRALGHLSPGTMTEFNDMTKINIPNAELSDVEMIADLLNANETVVRTLRNALEPAGTASDEATVDLITARLQYHEKTAWMFRSYLEK